MSKNTIVVGAGGGGIASALLAATRGEKVTLLEAHSALGGCASWFRRGSFFFDAGATTLSGVGVNEPLGILFEKLGRAPNLVAADPGIVFHLSDGRVIHYYRDFEKWMNELSDKFPHLNHRPFWNLVRKINSQGWAILQKIKTFPFKTFNDFFDLVNYPEGAFLLPFLLVSTDHMLKVYDLDQDAYKELVNGILLISAQAESAEIPFFVGAMGLSYPAETYAPVGGMKGLMEFFENELLRCDVEIKKRTKVSRYEKGEIFLDNGQVLSADKIIFNLPIWNLVNLTDGKLSEKLKRESKNHPGHWGAFTLYFGIQGHFRQLYHQIHLNNHFVKNYFVSFSVPDDESRAPSGHQAVSISTHVDALEKIDRELLTKIILDDFQRRFNIAGVKFLTTGTPKTFERYTCRENGFVGGLPFLYGKNPLSMISSTLHEEGLYRVGDTVFPGQGLCGVVAGALQLHRRLS